MITGLGSRVNCSLDSTSTAVAPVVLEVRLELPGIAARREHDTRFGDAHLLRERTVDAAARDVMHPFGADAFDRIAHEVDDARVGQHGVHPLHDARVHVTDRVVRGHLAPVPSESAWP